MFGSANQSEPFKRFLEEFFGELTYMRWHEGTDVSLLHQLSAQERRLAEDLMIEALEKGDDNFRLLGGLSELRSQRAIPLIIQYLQRTDLGGQRMYAAIALRNFPCQQVAQALEDALSDDDKLLRCHAARSLLAIYNVPEPGPDLIPLADGTFREDLAQSRQALSVRVMSSDLQKRETAITELLALCKERLLPPC